MRGSTDKRRKRHDENACADCGFQLVPEHAGQNQKHHHTAARADESANKADDYATENGLEKLDPTPLLLVELLGRHNGLENKFNAEYGRHDEREGAHGILRNVRSDITAEYRKDQNRHQHDFAVFEIQIIVFSVCIR